MKVDSNKPIAPSKRAQATKKLEDFNLNDLTDLSQSESVNSILAPSMSNMMFPIEELRFTFPENPTESEAYEFTKTALDMLTQLQQDVLEDQVNLSLLQKLRDFTEVCDFSLLENEDLKTITHDLQGRIIIELHKSIDSLYLFF